MLAARLPAVNSRLKGGARASLAPCWAVVESNRLNWRNRTSNRCARWPTATFRAGPKALGASFGIPARLSRAYGTGGKVPTVLPGAGSVLIDAIPLSECVLPKMRVRSFAAGRRLRCGRCGSRALAAVSHRGAASVCHSVPPVVAPSLRSTSRLPSAKTELVARHHSGGVEGTRGQAFMR